MKRPATPWSSKIPFPLAEYVCGVLPSVYVSIVTGNFYAVIRGLVCLYFVARFLTLLTVAINEMWVRAVSVLLLSFLTIHILLPTYELEHKVQTYPTRNSYGNNV